MGQEISDELVREIGGEVLRLSRPAVVAPAGLELDRSAFRLLWLLREEGTATTGRLVEILQVEQSTVSRQVRSALERGLVTFEPQPGSRSRRVRATDAGEQAFQRDLDRRGRIFRTALEHLGADRVRRLDDDLRRLNDALEAAHASARP
ncbi:MarR family winged helix-turn-helix transcriptional regulator [Aeromicrobium sp. 50.2.37]|uniref:MarR family winged helix-turn-helix transcriptional regulator n=1 Tax=Aeromicrobium sp. 50.2.37 TaxID=2969305 RepID=UPI00214FB242|nr:MarR family transcriptional regulator [Aeromicrobium sp. 50.2.37]MCR4514348.1 MarR family transcriptional regulator [Aeromicrobium sp. 50.2.37]